MAAYPKQLYTVHEKTFRTVSLTCDSEVKGRFLGIAAALAAYPTIGPQPIPDASSVFRVSVDDPLDFVHLGHRDSAHGCKSSSCSRPGVPVTPEPSEYHIRPLTDASRKNVVMNDTSPALLSPRCEQPLARFFVALIREDDACIVVR